MSMFLFNLRYREQIKSLMAKTGLSKEEAKEFMYKYYNENISFKDFFKGYIKSWVPDGNNAEGNVIALYTLKFPKREINLHQFVGKRDLNWFSLIG